MVATLAEVRDALAERVGEHLGDIVAYGSPVDAPVVPSFTVLGFRLIRDAFDGDMVTIDAQVASRHDDFATLDRLVDRHETVSVWAAIDADRTLNGTVDDCTIVSVGEYALLSSAGVQYLSADVTIEVMR